MQLTVGILIHFLCSSLWTIASPRSMHGIDLLNKLITSDEFLNEILIQKTNPSVQEITAYQHLPKVIVIFAKDGDMDRMSRILDAPNLVQWSIDRNEKIKDALDYNMYKISLMDVLDISKSLLKFPAYYQSEFSTEFRKEITDLWVNFILSYSGFMIADSNTDQSKIKGIINHVLKYLSFYNERDSIKYLMEIASARSYTIYVETPLFYAVKKNYLELITLIFSMHSVSQVQYENVFRYACSIGNLNVVKHLVQYTKYLDAKEKYQSELLFIIFHKHVSLLKFFKENPVISRFITKFEYKNAIELINIKEPQQFKGGLLSYIQGIWPAFAHMPYVQVVLKCSLLYYDYEYTRFILKSFEDESLLYKEAIAFASSFGDIQLLDILYSPEIVSRFVKAESRQRALLPNKQTAYRNALVTKMTGTMLLNAFTMNQVNVLQYINQLQPLDMKDVIKDSIKSAIASQQPDVIEFAMDNWTHMMNPLQIFQMFLNTPKQFSSSRLFTSLVDHPFINLHFKQLEDEFDFDKLFVTLLNENTDIFHLMIYNEYMQDFITEDRVTHIFEINIQGKDKENLEYLLSQIVLTEKLPEKELQSLRERIHPIIQSNALNLLDKMNSDDQFLDQVLSLSLPPIQNNIHVFQHLTWLMLESAKRNYITIFTKIISRNSLVDWKMKGHLNYNRHLIDLRDIVDVSWYLLKTDSEFPMELHSLYADFMISNLNHFDSSISPLYNQLASLLFGYLSFHNRIDDVVKLIAVKSIKIEIGLSLYAALEQGNTDLVSILLEKDFISLQLYSNLMIYSCSKGDLNAFKVLASYKKFSQAYNGYTHNLILILFHKHTHILDYLETIDWMIIRIPKGILGSVRSMLAPTFLDKYRLDWISEFMHDRPSQMIILAAEANDVSFVKFMIQLEKRKSMYGGTFLEAYIQILKSLAQSCSITGNLECIKFLISKQVAWKEEISDSLIRVIIEYSAGASQLHILDYMYENDYKYPFEAWVNGLHVAISYKKLNVVEHFTSHFSDYVAPLTIFKEFICFPQFTLSTHFATGLIDMNSVSSQLHLLREYTRFEELLTIMAQKDVRALQYFTLNPSTSQWISKDLLTSLLEITFKERNAVLLEYILSESVLYNLLSTKEWHSFEHRVYSLGSTPLKKIFSRHGRVMYRSHAGNMKLLI